MDVVRIEVRKGEIVDAGSWLYVWRRSDDGRVVYVGSTSAPPALRTWLHLHGDGPATARMRHLYEAAMEESFEVVAFRLPNQASRREAKDELIRQLDDADMLAGAYVGNRPQARPAEQAEDCESVVTPILRHLRGASTNRPSPSSDGFRAMRAALHHVELWTTDLAEAEDGWRWLLTTLGWSDGGSWTAGRTWTHPDGTYLVLEESPDVNGPHDRLRAGLNHLAVNCPSLDMLDLLRAQASTYGWHELFPDRYPHAGGPSHAALFLENAQGFEVEIVAPDR